MSRRIDRPKVLYEVVPERFAQGVDAPGSPLVRLAQSLDYFADLAADALVLSPIFPSADTRKNEALDYFSIDPKVGSEAELQSLCMAAKKRDIDIVMSGVFDHVSKDHAWFKQALSHTDDESRYLPNDRTRSFFSFGDEYAHGYRCCEGDPGRPEFNLKNPALRRRLFTGEQSVIHHWLNHGIRGWRMLRADAVGYSILRESVRASQTVFGNHFVVGDVRGFADRYVKDGLLDGAIHYYQREAITSYLRGQIPARQVARVMRDVVRQYGGAALSGWNVLSGTNLARVGFTLRDSKAARLATVVSFCLPGVAHIFYGDEVGGLGAKKMPDHLPAMRFDSNHPALDLHKRLGQLRRERVAFSSGDFVDLTPEGEDEIFAFARGTKDPKQSVIVVVNRASQTRVRKLFAPFSDLPDGLRLRDVDLGGELRPDDPGAPGPVKVRSGSVTVEVPGQGVRILVPDEESALGSRVFREY